MFFVQILNPSTVNSREFFPSICINFYNLVHALLVLLVSFWLPRLFSWWPLSLTVLCKENHASLTAGISTHFSTFSVSLLLEFQIFLSLCYLFSIQETLSFTLKTLWTFEFTLLNLFFMVFVSTLLSHLLIQYYSAAMVTKNIHLP